MNSIRLDSQKVVHYGANHYGLEYLQHPEIQVAKDLQDSNLTADVFVGRYLVLDFRSEGQCPITAAGLIEYLQTLSPKQVVAVYNTSFSDNLLNYRAEQHSDFLSNFAGWFTNLDTVTDHPELDTKFLCLMRRPSVSRAKFGATLLKSISSLRLSFGCMSQSSGLGEFKSYFEQDLPILIDGTTDRSANTLEHNQNNPVFRQSMFNIVVESGDQSGPATWKSQFVTEKTFKAFGLRQIPIWFSVPGLVNTIRTWGFDMFDDMIDHRYDSIEDESQRMSAVIQQCMSLDRQFTLAQCVDLKTRIAERLDNNYNLLKHIATHRDDKFRDLLKELNET